MTWQVMLWEHATEQAKLDAACSDEMLNSNVMSAPLLGSHLSTPLFFRPGNVNLAIKLAASLSEDTTRGGVGSGLLLRTSHV
jgi:hypothetical protein